jgi:adenine-specific DNA methylase
MEQNKKSKKSLPTVDCPLSTAQSFIEEQFPVSKESYKERKAGASQTLTSLGKWWGRKPLVLVRAAIIGMLMPVSGDPEKDREIFLKIMTMDNVGLWQRRSKSIPAKVLQAHLTEEEWQELIYDSEGKAKRIWSTGLRERKGRGAAQGL